MKTYMAIDQYGTTYHDLGPHPRKALMDRLGCQHISKMYGDTINGKTFHIGYVVGRYWCSLYEVTPFKKEQS